jgi:hypothetical protein
MNHISRRTFVLGTTSVLGIASLAATACGGSSDSKASDETTSGTNTDVVDAVLVGRFASGTLVSAIPQRLVYSLANQDGSAVSKGPATFAASAVLDGATTPVVALEFTRRTNPDTGPFWTATGTFPEPGNWLITATLPGGKTADAATTVIDAKGDPIPNLGDTLVGSDTPTMAAPNGVNPVCTRDPVCSLHDVTLNAALQAAKPVALLIGTPKYCQTGVCGPVLDLLLAEHDRLGDKMTMLHAEVYATDYTGPETAHAPVVDAFNLSFEPYLVIADATGVIRGRLDVVWDAEELRDALDAVISG